MPSPAIDLARICRALEIPDCGCPMAPLDCGKVFGCELRLKGKPCDCPTVLPPACKHILAREHKRTVEEWARLLIAAWPRDYTEPPLPEAPHQALRKEARVAIMTLRAGIKKSGGAPVRALRHPQDLDPQKVDHVSRTGILAKNGRWRDASLRAESGQKSGERGAWSVEREKYVLPENATHESICAGMVRLNAELAALEPDDAHTRDYARAVEAVRKAGPLKFEPRKGTDQTRKRRRQG